MKKAILAALAVSLFPLAAQAHGFRCEGDGVVVKVPNAARPTALHVFVRAHNEILIAQNVYVTLRGQDYSYVASGRDQSDWYRVTLDLLAEDTERDGYPDDYVGELTLAGARTNRTFQVKCEFTAGE
ncbi:MAG: hypothetical protein ACXVBW_02760 [Bdellovibrionota bacterium]